MNAVNICVIIPSYNEGAVVRSTLISILKYGYTIILVDDCSTDDTRRITNDLPVHYLRHSINLGQGAAIQTGIQYALTLNIDYVVTFDADGQHNADDISLIVHKLRASAVDIVFGSRFLNEKSPPSMSWTRKMVLKIARCINFFISGVYLTDAHNGLRALTSDAAAKINLRENRMSHATELLIEVKSLGLKYTEFQSRVIYTGYSKGKGQRNIDGLAILKDIIIYKIFKQ